jgi:hypothetical protein
MTTKKVCVVPYADNSDKILNEIGSAVFLESLDKRALEERRNDKPHRF